MVLGANVLRTRANEQYNVKITDFEGPLDLLLHLIREQKLDIKTVRLADVTGQYLEFLEQLAVLDLELANEFIEVAATLIEIKSRGILPRPVVEEDPEDIEMRLLQQLEEYKLLKEASEKLKETENVDRFYKDIPEFKPEYKFVLDNLSLELLTTAFQKVMHRVHSSAAPITARQVQLDRFTVQDKIKDIRDRVKSSVDGTPLMFFDLFEEDFTKSEMINTFLALLELLKTGEIKAVQQDAFSDITITSC